MLQSAGSDRAKWEQTAVVWFGYANENLARFTASGPASWQRITDAQAKPTLRREPLITVSNVHVTNDTVRFHVSQTGTPVLVRVSYFPWWHASGAQGPYRASPDWMIVVPTSHDVVLSQQTQPVEWFATVLTVLGGLFAIALAVWVRLKRSRTRRAA